MSHELDLDEPMHEIEELDEVVQGEEDKINDAHPNSATNSRNRKLKKKLLATLEVVMCTYKRNLKQTLTLENTMLRLKLKRPV